MEAADEARRFRHFLRHAYGAEIDGERVRAVAERWLAAIPSLESDFDRFSAFLRGLADRLEKSAG